MQCLVQAIENDIYVVYTKRMIKPTLLSFYKKEKAMAPKVSEEYKSQKKIDLLQAAKRVFIEKGYIRATMQDIIDEAGISRGALYAYFDNIEHVYMELLQLEDQQDVFAFSLHDEDTTWQQLTKWIWKQHKEIEHIDQTLLLANSEFFMSANYKMNKESYPYITARYERIIDVLARFFQQGIDQGDLSPRLPVESVSRYLVSFIDGLMMGTAHLSSERTKVKEQIETLLFTLKEMLCPIDQGKEE
jgi:AcrR family transcriptional regulator